MCSICKIVTVRFIFRIEMNKSTNLNLFKSYDMYYQLLLKNLYHFFTLWCFTFTTSAFCCWTWINYLLLPRLLKLRTELTQSLWVGMQWGQWGFWVPFIFCCLTGVIFLSRLWSCHLAGCVSLVTNKNCAFKTMVFGVCYYLC